MGVSKKPGLLGGDGREKQKGDSGSKGTFRLETSRAKALLGWVRPFCPDKDADITASLLPTQ